MTNVSKLFIASVSAVALAVVVAGNVVGSRAEASEKRANVVGAWYFDAPAPFVEHLATFHADGTMVIMFPDAAEADRSASTGAGVWERGKKGVIRGKFYEINATRSTNRFESDLVVTFTITVNGDAFTGTASAVYLDRDGNVLEGPYDGPLTGRRITI